MIALRFRGPAHHSAPGLRRSKAYSGHTSWAGLPGLLNAKTGSGSTLGLWIIHKWVINR